MKVRTLIALLVALLLAGSCANSDVAGRSAEQTASQPAPSQLSKSNSGWKDLVATMAGEMFLGAERGVIFYAYDVLAYPNEPVELAGRVHLARILKDLPGVSVGFYLGSELIGTAETDDQGQVAIRWTPPKPGDYSFTARITAVPEDDYQDLLEVSPAPLLVAVRKKKTPFVVIDLDHTLVASSFFRVLLGEAEPMTDSVKVTRKIAKNYSIIYLTQRPELLTRKSKLWLSDHDYPAGVLLLSELGQALSGSSQFKTSRLASIKKSFPNVRIGIGDKPSDAQAYVDNGLAAYLIPHYKAKPKDMRKMAEQIGKLRSRGRLQVVQSWSEIEAGIFKDRKFPVEDFLGYLRRQADQLEIQENRRQEQDDD